jgi:hypothetical protein
MTTLASLRQRLHEIAATASTAAEALDAGRVDFLPGELGRHLGRLDALAAGLAEVCELPAAGVDPQGAPPSGLNAAC